MNGPMLVSYIFLWLVTLCLAFCVVVLTQQLGVLHLRFGPRGALRQDDGPEIGSAAPAFSGVDTNGSPCELATARVATTIVFVSPGCSTCVELLPALRTFAKSLPKGHRVLVVSNGSLDHQDQDQLYANLPSTITVLPSPVAFEVYNIDSTPYAVYIDDEGIVRMKGVVNTLEQLEELVAEPIFRDVENGPLYNENALL